VSLPHIPNSDRRTDDACRIEIAMNFASTSQECQFAIHVGFAHPARDQLGVLRTEIEDEDFFMDMVGVDAYGSMGEAA